MAKNIETAKEALTQADLLAAYNAAQDWMCEPFILAKTGLTVLEHQKRTISNYLELRSLAPELPIIPVLQGYTRDEYLRCRDAYMMAGVDLTQLPLVGLGSVCRRQRRGIAIRAVGKDSLKWT